MSNHQGSYMLNEVLQEIHQRGLLAQLPREEMQQLILRILTISTEYDCNKPEILEGLAIPFGLCRCCSRATEEFVGEMCPACIKAYTR